MAKEKSVFENLTGSLRDTVEEKLDPSKVFSGRNLKKKARRVLDVPDRGDFTGAAGRRGGCVPERR